MTRTTRMIGLLAILLLSAVPGLAQDERSMEDRLVTFTHQLRMGLTLATVAAHSPTLTDLRLHAQQLINLLEGADGPHFVPFPASQPGTGLVAEWSELRTRFNRAIASDDVRRRVVSSAATLSTYLSLALTATLDGLEQRRLDTASTDMLRAYAFLAAAYEKPCDAMYVPALWTILRAFSVAERVETTD